MFANRCKLLTLHVCATHSYFFAKFLQNAVLIFTTLQAYEPLICFPGPLLVPLISMVHPRIYSCLRHSFDMDLRSNPVAAVHVRQPIAVADDLRSFDHWAETRSNGRPLRS